MQTYGIDYAGVNAEMKEVRRLFGKGAHPFLWVTRRYLDSLPRVASLVCGFYEGIKLHGMDGSRWITENDLQLEEVLMFAERHDKPVMIHTGCNEDARPINYLPFILKHPRLRFDLAHGRPLDETEVCMDATSNVFVDVSCMDIDTVLKLVESGWADRLLWGTDFPVLAAVRGESLTNTMRSSVQVCECLSKEYSIDFAGNFRRYLTSIND